MVHQNYSVMVCFKRAYDYCFYKLYKSFEAAPSQWLSDWKASFSLIVVEIWVSLSVLNFVTVFLPKIRITDRFLVIASLILVVCLAVIKYFTFEHQDRWKTIVKEFDKIPKRKNRIGTVVVWGAIFLVLTNMILSFYLLSRTV